MRAATDTAHDWVALAPNDGRAILVLLDDWARFVCCGTAGDVDRVGTAAGRVLTWATADACHRHAHEAGWVIGSTEPIADVASVDAVDGPPVQTWLHRPCTPLDQVSKLTF